MNRVDAVILIIVFLFMIFGYQKGLVKTILNIVQYIAVIILSFSLAPAFSKVLIERANLDLIIIDWAKNNHNLFSDTITIISEEILQNITGRIINVVSVIILFIVLKIVFSIVISILNKIANLPIISVVNKLGGLILGACNGILVSYMLIVLINWVPLEFFSQIRMDVKDSLLGEKVSAFIPEVATEAISLVKTSV